MALSIGIVGLPNVGKSTLFKALTNRQVEASNYPFCTIDPNIGVVKVPDLRLEKLAKVSKSAEIIPTIVEFADIAGLVKDAHKGEGLGNKFLHNIRECDAICEVVRDFENDNIIHVDGNIDPIRDKETINLELIFADLQSVEKQLERAVRDAKGNDKEKIIIRDLLARIKSHLEEEGSVRTMEFSDDEMIFVKQFNLLTIKPILYVINTDKKDIEYHREWDGEVLTLNIKTEAEIAELSEEEQEEFIKELGMDQSGLDKLANASYKLLDLITFFTTGPQETRAWTVKNGAKAPQAAGVIHTDFEKGFIRAEVVNWQSLVDVGGEQMAREKGLIRTEGKDYLMQDGDTCHFLHN